MKLDVESVVEKFKEDFLAGSFKKDDLANDSKCFHGEVEKQDFEKFRSFSQSDLFHKILDL